MDSKYQNLDLTRAKRIYFCLFQSIFVYWEWHNFAEFTFNVFSTK